MFPKFMGFLLEEIVKPTRKGRVGVGTFESTSWLTYALHRHYIASVNICMEPIFHPCLCPQLCPRVAMSK